jgi:hypothetical protein
MSIELKLMIGPLRIGCLFGSLSVVGALMGCGHMPVASMVKLARVDFAKTDPAQMRAAVKVPRVVKPKRVAMRIIVKITDGPEEEQDLVLREVSEPAELMALQNELDADTHIFAYRLEPADVVRLSTLRDTLRQRREAAGRRGGTLTISIRPEGCRTADLGERPLHVTTYLRTAETGGYVPLARDLDLRTISPGRDVAAEIPPCG